jgi:hypothetical protein
MHFLFVFRRRGRRVEERPAFRLVLGLNKLLPTTTRAAEKQKEG